MRDLFGRQAVQEIEQRIRDVERQIGELRGEQWGTGCAGITTTLRPQEKATTLIPTHHRIADA